MGHHIEAFVGKPDAIRELLSPIVYDSPYRHNLPQGFQLLLCDYNKFAELAYAYLQGRAELSGDPFDHMVQYAELTCTAGMVGYFRTDYFAGLGNQAAILIRRGKAGAFLYDSPRDMEHHRDTVYPQSLTSFLINTVLKELGVQTTDGDAFDSIHLSDYRHMPDWQ